MTSLVELGRDGDIAVLTISNPPVNTINSAVRAALSDALRDLGTPKALVLRCEGSAFYGSMHWQPAPLLERLVREGKRLADWEQERSG